MLSGKATACCVLLPPAPAHPCFNLPLHPAERQESDLGLWNELPRHRESNHKTIHRTSWHTGPFEGSYSCLKDHTHLRASAPRDLGAPVQHQGLGQDTTLISQPAGHSWAPALCDSSPWALPPAHCGTFSSAKQTKLFYKHISIPVTIPRRIKRRKFLKISP